MATGNVQVIGPIRAVATQAPAPDTKSVLEVRGMFGIGDCLFQRAVIRELMKKHEIVLESYYGDMYKDLEERGLKLSIVADRGRIKDDVNRNQRKDGVTPVPGRFNRDQLRITYDRNSIHKCGSILAAMFESANLRMPAEPDFSLPVRPAWIASWRAFLAEKKISTGGKPIAIYRPIVLNTGWTAPARAPDPEAYGKIFESIRDKFFWVSIADLRDKGSSREWVVGKKQKVDLALEAGELDFKTLVGLFASAKMVFANPGFVPVLAHACRTPVVIVYGANESFRTTNSVGKHLSPTLGIDIDKPCECHAQSCTCPKKISIKPAVDRLERFVEAVMKANPKESEKAVNFETKVTSVSPKVLIFGTVYSDTKERSRLTKLWGDHHLAINPDCDFLLVDSKSPEWPSDLDDRVARFSFGDNIGHLSRNGPRGPGSGGRDGWGRAFSKGLQMAIDKGYDYVVHIEGDSLFKWPVRPIIKKMIDNGYTALTVPVQGTKRVEKEWAETGLMFFSVPFLKRTDFIKNYDWAKRQASPTPERVIYAMLSAHGAAFRVESWGAYRGDKNQIDESNIERMDWVTHVRGPDGMDNMKLFEQFSSFARNDEPKKEEAPPAAKVMINLGCGTNKLAGWQNYDANVDITKRLPFTDSSADFIFAEHVVEHVGYYEAIRFFQDARRVLKPGGVIRITGPSLFQIYDRGDDPDYISFLHERKWAPTKDLRGALHAILFCHGHKTAWTEELMMATLYYAGFKEPTASKLGWSRYPELRGVEGHQRVIGEKFNSIESIAVEAMADK